MINAMQKLCIGTAQLGMDYGATNRNGKVTEELGIRLLEMAMDKGMTVVDTAEGYGNAEEIIGKAIAKGLRLDVISKIGERPNLIIDNECIQELEKSINNSLMRLKVEQLDTLLLHSTKDLKKPGGEGIIEWLKQLKESGKVCKIGLSIYDHEEISYFDKYELDAVQVPISIYDQRLVKGDGLKRLVDKKLEIHARSIFLQGLILERVEKWPKWTNSRLRKHHRKICDYADTLGMSLCDMAFSFIRNIEEVNGVVVGVCNVDQLNEICASWKKVENIKKDGWTKWSIEEKEWIDPRLWPS